MAEVTPPHCPETVCRLGAASFGAIAALSLGVLSANVGASAADMPVNQESIVVSLPVFLTSIAGTAWCVWMVAGWNAVRKNKEDGLEREIQALRNAIKEHGIEVPKAGKK